MIFSGGRHFALFLKNARTAYFCPILLSKVLPPGRWQSRVWWVWESFTIPAFLVICIEDQFVDWKTCMEVQSCAFRLSKEIGQKAWGPPSWEHLMPFPKLPVRLCAKSLSHVQLFATLWTAALQAPLSTGFSRQDYWRELPRPLPGDLPSPGIELVSLTPTASTFRFFTTSTIWEALGR